MIITTTVEIPPRRIADLMVTAIEGGIGYWCKSVKLVSAKGMAQPWYDDENLFEVRAEELQIMVTELDPHQEHHNGEWFLDLRKMENAFKLMQEFGNPKGYCWRDFLSENDDATTADVWFQLAVFGEVVYG